VIEAGTRLTSELLSRLRRSGLAISTAQSLLAAQAMKLVPWDKVSLKTALGAVLATNAKERALFNRAFDAYFARGAHDRSLRERLTSKGLSEAELADIATVLDVEQGYLTRSSNFDQEMNHALRRLIARGADGQAGAHTYRLLGKLGQAETLAALAPLRLFLRDAYGAERAEEILQLLQEEERATAQLVRELVGDALSDAQAPAPLLNAQMDPTEYEQVKRSVRAIAEKLSAGFRSRKKRMQKRRLDGPRTLRASMQTGGYPLKLHYRSRSKRKPKLVLLCDLSDSVRHAARLLLELIAGAHELFHDTRSFVFVSEVYETTALFRTHSADAAFEQLAAGAHVPTTHISNYGRALGQFAREHLRAIDRDTTVLILGDGRTNFHDPGSAAIQKIRSVARNVYWLVPESRVRWSEGDSAMHVYEPLVTRALEVTTLRQLEDVARMIAR
jgi:uncharacterized protein